MVNGLKCLPLSAQVVRHDGHLDYVVNGRLIHPIPAPVLADDGDSNGVCDASRGKDREAAPTFEDHGSIRDLTAPYEISNDDFLTFWSGLDALNETADEAVTAWCDMCWLDEMSLSTAAGPAGAPPPSSSEAASGNPPSASGAADAKSHSAGAASPPTESSKI